jgi:hypothetical protein
MKIFNNKLRILYKYLNNCKLDVNLQHTQIRKRINLTESYEYKKHSTVEFKLAIKELEKSRFTINL